MLTGSRVSEMVSTRLDQLSTYGLLREEGTVYVTNLLASLEKAGLLVTRRTPYALLGLSTRGAQVMRGEETFRMAWPDRNAGRSRKENVPSLEDVAFDEDLFEELKVVRKQVAEDAGGKPPFLIFGNQVLEFFARIKPTTQEEAMKIGGVGKFKAENYLEPFLEAIRDWDDD